MSKRRTKKQKAQAKHQFKISWKPSEKTDEFEPEKEVFKAGVKGQFPDTKTQDEQKATKKELAKISAENKNLGTIKHDLLRSLLLASFIFSLEVVLYLFWQ
ncbi:hypothetical protein KKB40_01515 [Patescibacteria group bacterium]|nr:hypothetical protein [Patescibacteria group bacterium]